jgi:hypothetical protein
VQLSDASVKERGGLVIQPAAATSKRKAIFRNLQMLGESVFCVVGAGVSGWLSEMQVSVEVIL